MCNQNDRQTAFQRVEDMFRDIERIGADIMDSPEYEGMPAELADKLTNAIWGVHQVGMLRCKELKKHL